ncbi:Phosphoglycolate phosphatase [Streptococcus sp. DD10]|uniref:HAD hydrolase-like protein n=1 Tax=Streptococcus sp. DD10 TaxID=1777878 RepID=UPI00079916F2|nr:HAD hydrolase-like protein [Streptococcus sp. DD10]KXT74258.1 Phosphoglycolate phosphatase [Streptococcus sp. DD10]
MKFIFFDLDGTLIDSSEGIYNSFVHTFETLNLPVPDTKTIQSFMGPPLEVTFKEQIGQDKVDIAIQYYRDYYKKIGQFQAKLFPGIRDLLKNLKENKNLKLYITTSKNEPITLQMCKDLGITTYFDGIYGSIPEAFHKADVLHRALLENQADEKQSIIIGDTKFDLIGGKEVGISTLAITWGFGRKKDLLAENPDYIADRPTDILTLLNTI